MSQQDFWTPERVSLITELRAVHYKSASQIARAVGTTRNAVIGKLFRMGIVSHINKGGRPRKPSRPRQQGITLPTIKPAGARSIYKRGYRPRREPAVSLPPPISEYATLAHRTGCAWPVNEGGPFLFCNAILDDSHSPYCPHHQQRMYVPRGRS